jgi:hypothetical protein
MKRMSLMNHDFKCVNTCLVIIKKGWQGQKINK